jgi:hypothetical protein
MLVDIDDIRYSVMGFLDWLTSLQVDTNTVMAEMAYPLVIIDIQRR